MVKRRLLLILIITAGVLNYVDRQVIAILKPLLQEKLGWTDMTYGSLAAVFQLSSAVAYLGVGRLVDRIGWKWSNPLAVGSWSLAAGAHALTRTLGQFTLARVTLGATEAFGTPAAIKSIAALFTAKERSLALGLMNAASNLGAIIAPLTIPAIALSYGWQATFLLVGGLGLLWVAAWILASRGVEAEAPAQADNAPAPPQRGAWLAALRDRRTLALAGCKMLSDQVWWLLLFWMPDFFHRVFGLDMEAFGPPIAVIYAAAASGSVLGGWVAGWLIRRKIPCRQAHLRTMLGCALLAVPIAGAPHVAGPWIAVCLFSLTLAAHQGFAVNLFALTSEIVPGDRLATVISIIALFGNLGGMAVLRLAGWMIGGGDGYAALFAFMAASYLLALGWFRLVIPRETT